jgi:hypothetical protein
MLGAILKSILFILFIFFIFHPGECQIPAQAYSYYEQGQREYKAGNFKLADSLFTEAIKNYRWPEAFYNKASASIQMGNLKEYCINLKEAADLGDEGSQEKYKERCTATTTTYRDQNNLYCTKEVASCSEVITKDQHALILNYSKYIGDSLELSMVINKRDTAFIFCQEMVPPEFIGGEQMLLKFLSDNVKYPPHSHTNNITDIIYVVFIVESGGEISSIRIRKGKQIDLIMEVIRVINIMPAWNPGKCNGVPVSMQFELPIRFKLK